MTHDQALILWTIGLVELVHLLLTILIVLWFFAAGRGVDVILYPPEDR